MEPIASYTADISLGVFLDITLKRIIVSSQKFGVTILSSTGEFERLITDTGLVMQRACNNDVYATASDDGVIRVFDLNTGSKIHTFDTQTRIIRFVAIAGLNPTILAAACYDGSVRLWDLETAKQTHKLSGHEGFVGFVAIQDPIVISSGVDNTVRTWDLKSGSPLHVLRGHKGCITHVAFSDDREIMVTGDYKGVVLVWSLEDGSCVASLNTFASSKDEHSERLTALQFLPMHLVTTSGNGQMCFFNIATWTLEREIQAHNALCSGVVWTGNELVTTGLDNRMKVWSYSVIDSEIESVLLFEKTLDGVVHLRSGERSREMVTVEYPGSPNGVLGKTMKMCTWNLNKAEGLVEM